MTTLFANPWDRPGKITLAALRKAAVKDGVPQPAARQMRRRPLLRLLWLRHELRVNGLPDGYAEGFAGDALECLAHAGRVPPPEAA